MRITHEVNEPLSAILMNAEAARRWLAMDPPDLDAAKRIIERILGDGRRAADVVRSARGPVWDVPRVTAGHDIHGHGIP